MINKSFQELRSQIELMFPGLKMLRHSQLLEFEHKKVLLCSIASNKREIIMTLQHKIFVNGRRKENSPAKGDESLETIHAIL